MRIKICGITNEVDMRLAVDAGADTLGFNFVGGPRRLDLETGERLLKCLPPMVTPVALLSVEDGAVDEDVFSLLEEYRVRHVQLYGEVDSAVLSWMSEMGYLAMTVAHVTGPDFAVQAQSRWADCPPPAAVVLDAFDAKQAGGTGKTFHWEWVVQARARGEMANWPPLVLAGGLNPDNIAEAVRTVQPFAVDVSSGVEVEGKPGKKDRDRMRAFAHNARIAAETLWANDE